MEEDKSIDLDSEPSEIFYSRFQVEYFNSTQIQ